MKKILIALVAVFALSSWSIILVETIVVPVWLIGYDIYCPVGVK